MNNEYVHVDKLQELIETIYDEAEDTADYGFDASETTLERCSYLTKAEGMRYTARKLEELINNE